MKTINDLVGQAKARSDLKSHYVRSRYNQNNGSMGSNEFMRLTMPRFKDEYADMSTLFLRFKLSTSGPDGRYLDSLTAASLFSRIVVKNGSSVIFDLSEFSMFMSIEQNLKSSKSTESKMDRYLRGHGSVADRIGWSAEPNREYMIKIGPENSILNSNHLLPLSSMSDFHIEFYSIDAPKILFNSSNSSVTDYVLNDIELHCTYLSSSSIRDHFVSNPPRFHVTDISHRFNNVNSKLSLLRLPSSYTSLNSVLTFIHNDKRLLGVDDYYGRGISGALIQETQVFINSQNLYDQPVDSLEQAYRHLQSAFPSVCESEYFDQDFRTTKYLNVQHLSAAPPEFSAQISSGIQTSALNSEIVVQIKFTTDGFSSAPVIADSFLFSDVVISLSPNGGELTVKY
jgi:hypothetical protein